MIGDTLVKNDDGAKMCQLVNKSCLLGNFYVSCEGLGGKDEPKNLRKSKNRKIARGRKLNHEHIYQFTMENAFW